MPSGLVTIAVDFIATKKLLKIFLEQKQTLLGLSLDTLTITLQITTTQKKLLAWYLVVALFLPLMFLFVSNGVAIVFNGSFTLNRTCLLVDS